MMKFIEKHYFFLLMFTGMLIGTYLRLYRLGSQIIWDDEWHGIHSAIFNSLKNIVTHFYLNDNCIPLAIYYKIMLESIGLNEIIIRLPQLLSGILIIIIFPLIIKRLINKRVAILFLFMLVISPLLIYYSRLARPYSIVVFLSFISIFSFYLWMTERKRIYVLVYLVSAVLAPYFSLSSLAFVSAPILYSIIMSLTKRILSFKNAGKNILQVKHVVFITFALIAGIAIWLLPAVGTLSEVIKKNGQGFVDLGTLGGCAFLFCGSNSYIICFAMLVLFMYGLCVFYDTNKLLLSYLCSICLFQLLFILVTRPNLVQHSTIFTRYSISSLPIWLLIISLALNELHSKLSIFMQKKTKLANAFSYLILLWLLLLAFLKGPVTDAYSFPNDFTNHKDFQYNYLDRALNRAGVREKLYPDFYLDLKNQVRNMTLIEYPAIISWTWNIFHVYQSFHHNRVLVGYDSGVFGPFFGYDTFNNKNIKFRNFIDISNPRLLLNSGADFVILHKNIWKECVAVGLYSPAKRHKMESRLTILSASNRKGLQKYVARVNTHLEKVLGEPFYEDDWITVYKIKLHAYDPYPH